MKKLITSLLIASLALSFAGCAVAQKMSMSSARSAVVKNDYETALTRLADAQKYTTPTPELQAEICYLRGYCYEMRKQMPDALATYKYTADTFPTTIYAYQAKERLAALGAKTN